MEAAAPAYGFEPALNWSGTEAGGLALDFIIEPTSRTDCKVSLRWNPLDSEFGFNGFLAERASATSANWIIMGNGWHDAHVHVGDVDTRGTVAYLYDPAAGRIEWGLEALEQPRRITLGLAGLRAGPDPNVEVAAGCLGDHAVTHLFGGRNAAIFDARQLREGVGASVDVLLASAGVAMAEGLSFESKGKRTQLFVVDSYEHAGRLQLTHPSGVQTYTFTPNVDEPPTIEFNGGRGAYRVELTEVDVLGGNLWGALLELHGLESIDELDALPGGHGHACADAVRGC